MRLTSAVNPLATATLPVSGRGAVAVAAPGNGDFAQALRQAAGKPNEARIAAQQFVATALIEPLLDQMQEDPFRTELFHGGQAEKLFTQRLNTELADRISAGTRLPIVDAVYRKLGQSTHAWTKR